jgi:type III restriction enzyme
MHDYIPDYVLRLNTAPETHLMVETKGYDEREDVKVAAAKRWVNAVNVDGTYGKWAHGIAKRPMTFHS